MTPELNVLLRSADEYARLTRDYPAIGIARALLRPIIAALAIGVAIALGATGTATVPLVASTALCWSFAVGWQLLAALTLVGPPHASLTLGQRLDLFFIGHAPWSIWLLTCAVSSRLMPDFTDLYAVLSTAIIPAVWTAFIVHGFCTAVIGLSPARAFWRTLLHQAIIWLFAFFLIAWAVALWPRLQS